MEIDSGVALMCGTNLKLFNISRGKSICGVFYGLSAPCDIPHDCGTWDCLFGLRLLASTFKSWIVYILMGKISPDRDLNPLMA